MSDGKSPGESEPVVDSARNERFISEVRSIYEAARAKSI